MTAVHVGSVAAPRTEIQGVELPRVLFVDDDERLLAGIALRLRRSFNVTTATNAVDALALLDLARPFAAVVSDMRMPKNDGASFLSAIRRVAPETTRMLLTGQADVQSAIAAVNEGEVFRYLLKPIEGPALTLALEQAVARHEHTMSERHRSENVMRELVNFMMIPVASLAPGFAAEIRARRQLVVQVCSAVGPNESWVAELACVALHVALSSVPAAVSARWLAREALSGDEQSQIDRTTQHIIQLIGTLPGTAEVCDTFAWMLPLAARSAGWHFPPTVSIATRVLHMVLTFESRMLRDCSAAQALSHIRDCAADSDSRIVNALATAVSDANQLNVPLFRLCLGQQLESEVQLVTGIPFLPAGHEVTAKTLELITGLDAISRHMVVRIAPDNKRVGVPA